MNTTFIPNRDTLRDIGRAIRFWNWFRRKGPKGGSESTREGMATQNQDSSIAGVMPRSYEHLDIKDLHLPSELFPKSDGDKKRVFDDIQKASFQMATQALSERREESHGSDRAMMCDNNR